jgi:hypothetical protein
MSVVVVSALPVPDTAPVIAAFGAASGRFHDRPGAELYALHEVRGRLVVIKKYESEQARSEHRQGTALAPATWADVTATSAVDDTRRRTPATTPPGTASPDLVTATPERPRVGGSPLPLTTTIRSGRGPDWHLAQIPSASRTIPLWSSAVPESPGKPRAVRMRTVPRGRCPGRDDIPGLSGRAGRRRQARR